MNRNIYPVLKAIMVIVVMFIMFSMNTRAEDISTCRDLNATGTIYVLTQNISSIGSCINVTAFNVTLDGSGYTINYSSTGAYGVGINISRQNNTVIKNVRVVEGSATTSSKYGIYVYFANNTIIYNNTIYTNGTSSNAIYLLTSGNANIDSNIINTSGTTAFGIYLMTSSNNNTVQNNNLYGISDTLLYVRNSNGNTVNNNSVKCVSKAGAGNALGLAGSNNNYLSNNDLTAANGGSSVSGILFATNNNYNNIFVNNTVRAMQGTSAIGIQITTTCNNCTFSGMNIQTALGAIGIQIAINNNLTITDSIINSTTDVRISSASVKAGYWNFTNVSRKDGKPLNVSWIAGANGTLNNMWYLDVYANYTNGTAAPSAQINATDIYGVAQTTTADANGNARFTLLEYIQNGSGGNTKTFSSNYSINASIAGQGLNISLNMSTNRFQVFTFTPTGGATSCTYGGSGNWALNCADNCIFNTAQIIANGDNVTITGTGTLTFNSGGIWTFTGFYQYVNIYPGCVINIYPGGGWNT